MGFLSNFKSLASYASFCTACAARPCRRPSQEPELPADAEPSPCCNAELASTKKEPRRWRWKNTEKAMSRQIRKRTPVRHCSHPKRQRNPPMMQGAPRPSNPKQTPSWLMSPPCPVHAEMRRHRAVHGGASSQHPLDLQPLLLTRRVPKMVRSLVVVDVLGHLLPRHLVRVNVHLIHVHLRRIRARV